MQHAVSFDFKVLLLKERRKFKRSGLIGPATCSLECGCIVVLTFLRNSIFSESARVKLAQNHFYLFQISKTEIMSQV